MMQKRAYFLINAITWYRLLASVLLLYLIFTRNLDLFKWLLAFSFFTDLIDGFLARKFKVTSIAGARLDSIADDATIITAVIGLFVFKPEFIHETYPVIIGLLALFLLQNVFALIKYKKITSFHTFSAKAAAILQGLFLIFEFLLAEPVYWLFYCAAIVTALELIEEILIVLILPKWEVNVKSIFSVLRRDVK